MDAVLFSGILVFATGVIATLEGWVKGRVSQFGWVAITVGLAIQFFAVMNSPWR